MEYYKCKFCNGKGSIFFQEKTSNLSSMSGTATCPRCCGKKKVDWIENIISKPKGYLIGLNLETFSREIWWDGSVVYRKGNFGA